MQNLTLLAEIEDVIVFYEQEIGNFAARTRLMIERYGPIDALSRLVVTPNLQRGFKVLRDANQLNHTFEALIIRNSRCFSNDAVKVARWRLDNADNLL